MIFQERSKKMKRRIFLNDAPNVKMYSSESGSNTGNCASGCNGTCGGGDIGVTVGVTVVVTVGVTVALLADPGDAI